MAEYQNIVVLGNEVQAELIDALLEERAIPHVMRSYHDSALDGLFQGGNGWGHVEAPGEYREEILAIFEEVKNQSAAAPGGSAPE
jgi:hypothetical protein